MSQIKSLDELKAIRDNVNEKLELKTNESIARVIVGMGTCGIIAGAGEVLTAIEEETKNNKLENISIIKAGCMGSCYCEPTVEIRIKNQKPILYGNVTPEKAREIVSKHLVNSDICKDNIVENPYKKQIRIATRNCGVINPECLEEYIGVDGYQALGKVITEYTQEQLIDIIKKSGLRGRGGAGFPTALKWDAARKSQSDVKYIICNADEGDPGAFMDRSILEGDPHSILEAMAIAGFAIGSSIGYIYIRAEYPLAIERLVKAINQAKERNLLGKNILGTNFSFDIHIRYGAGAFVCGEETSLINSVEGNRGEPTNKPPFPAEKGLWKKPTNVNNVETFANIPAIILKGSEWFSSIGTEKSKGTKVFSLAGKINNVGLAEVPMGMTLREIVFEIGGGIQNGKEFKAVQTGGPSGGCITKENLDTPIDYDSLANIGTMMGSGGMIVLDEDDCMVNIAKFYLEFTMDESCGKCTPCRIGNKRLHEILTKIVEGKATENDLKKLKELSLIIKDTALCGLGQTSPNPVLSTMNYFWDEYIGHVRDKKCKAGVCKALLDYKIKQEKCTGCTACKRACPTNCISGEVKKPHSIDNEKCIRCGACFETCKFKAIERS